MIISLIIALDENNVIGQDDRIPWNEPEDMMWFVTKTRHKAIVMGRKTFDGLHNPLPNRLISYSPKTVRSALERLQLKPRGMFRKQRSTPVITN